MPDDRSTSFEGSLTRLEQIVKALETEEPDLERAVLLYKEGKELVGRCEGLLTDAQSAIDAVNAPPAIAASASGTVANGSPVSTPRTSAVTPSRSGAAGRAVEDALDDDEIPF